MRLKLLFFPISIVVSVCVFMLYILPEIEIIGTNNKERTNYNNELKTVSEKIALLESLNSQIDSNKEDEIFIKNYLPEDKVEERIISGLNYLAVDSGVSLTKVTLESPVLADTMNASGGTADAISQATKDTKTAAAGDIPEDMLNSQIPMNIVIPMNYTKASISAKGDYENIKIFINQLQRMPIINSVNSLEIKKAPEEAPAALVTTNNGLLFDIVMDFNYLEPIKVSDQQKANFNVKEMDIQMIGAVREYISQVSQKTPSLDYENKNSGKVNPFIP